jgi:PTH1 family peptidyl-tRNA hydrolase
MKVVVGLGNPGAKYHGTRHNVGFAVIDELAAGPGCGPFKSRFQAQVAELREGGETLLLVKPETFMNLSGRTVQPLVAFYKVPLSDVLVVCDDINLPPGKLRVRANGSHGGHNGLRNIQELLGTSDYPRLRLGVGGPAAGGDEQVDHVLGRFKPGERPVIEEAVRTAVQAVLVWATQGIGPCMNRFNGGEPGAEKKPRPKKPKPDDENQPQDQRG